MIAPSAAKNLNPPSPTHADESILLSLCRRRCYGVHAHFPRQNVKPRLPSQLGRLLSAAQATTPSTNSLSLSTLIHPRTLRMNGHLTERFGRSRSAFRPESDRADVSILPQRLNEKIRQYFDDINSPVAGGDWITRSEIPTSEEILDEDTSSASGSVGGSPDVVIIPNKCRGPWPSKGKPLCLYSHNLIHLTSSQKLTSAHITNYYERTRSVRCGKLSPR